VKKLRAGQVFGVLVLAVVAFAGCDLVITPGGGGKADLTVLLSGDDGIQGKMQVEVTGANKQGGRNLDLESLTLTITEISLDRSPGGGDDDPNEGSSEGETEGADDALEGEEEGEGTLKSQEGAGDGEAPQEGDSEGDAGDEGATEGEDVGNKVIVFSGALDVNILDLAEISQILTSNQIPAGKYTKIRLSIENPRVVLADDPDTVLEDVQLTANGRLFISKSFELPEGPSLLLLDFEGIHLVQQGNTGDRFVLTPQLRANILVVEAAVTLTGPVAAVDANSSTLDVTVADGDVSVAAGAATIEDLNGVALGFGDIAVGQEVTVEGILTLEGTVNASLVVVGISTGGSEGEGESGAEGETGSEGSSEGDSGDGEPGGGLPGDGDGEGEGETGGSEGAGDGEPGGGEPNPDGEPLPGEGGGEGEGEAAVSEGSGEGEGAGQSEGGGEGEGESPAPGTKLNVLFSGDNTAVQKALLRLVSASSKMGPVDVADVESLTLTITEIELDYIGDAAFNTGELTVEVAAAEFVPTSLNVEAGDTVRWVWSVDVFHTITSGTAEDEEAGLEFDGSRQTVGDIFEVSFNTAGLFPYFSNTSEDIEAGMAGAIVVAALEEEEEDSDDKGAEPTSEGEGEVDGDGEGEPEGGVSPGADEPSRVVVFAGSLDVNIVELTELSEVLSSIGVPPGNYTKVRLSVSNPRLVLKAAPEMEIVDVQITANGTLFISKNFTIAEGGSGILLIDFGGVHLVERGNSGSYVLTPQLRAEIDVVSAAVTLTGTVTSLDLDNATMSVILLDSVDDFEIAVDIRNAVVLDSEGNEVSAELLQGGGAVTITGTMEADGSIVASEVVILDTGA